VTQRFTAQPEKETSSSDHMVTVMSVERVRSVRRTTRCRA
jgi:hypothetical protein